MLMIALCVRSTARIVRLRAVVGIVLPCFAVGCSAAARDAPVVAAVCCSAPAASHVVRSLSKGLHKSNWITLRFR